MLYNPLRFLFVPITTLVYALSLLYTRIHAFVTITDDGWGTRNVGSNEKKSFMNKYINKAKKTTTHAVQ